MPAKSTKLPWLIEAIKNHNSNECLIWPYCVGRDGYGHIGFGGRVTSVHRVAFFLTYGRWPKPCALHKCDVKLCFWPPHLFEGSKADNAADRTAKGRGSKGERQGSAKLTDDQVRQIRAEYKWGVKGCGTKMLARKYGVGYSTIHYIVTRAKWRHI